MTKSGQQAHEVPSEETVGLRIGSLENAIDLLGNVYNDVRDALNEFVANAYDEIVLGRVPNGVVHVKLIPRGKPPRIVVTDNGRGINREGLLRIARNIAKSTKPQEATPSMQVIGEKGIGILGFQALAERCQIITRHESAEETWCLELVKGSRQARLSAVDRRHLLSIPGTEVHLIGIDEPTFRVLTLPKLVDYFSNRWRSPLSEDAFILHVVQGKRAERVSPGRFEGEPFIMRVRTPLGMIVFDLYLTPKTQARKRPAVVGTGGVQVLRDITADVEFDRHPWNSDQIQGEVRFPPLRQTTGRRGLQRDRQAFPALVAAVEEVEQELTRRIELLNREHETQVDRRLSRAIRQAFKKALSEIEALSTAGLTVRLADPAGKRAEGSLFDEVAATAEKPPGDETGGTPGDQPGSGGTGGETDSGRPGQDRKAVEGDRGRTRQSPAGGLNYRPVPFGSSALRSRYSEALRTIEINSAHPDYQRAKGQDRRTLLDYMVMLVAKELALLNYQGINQNELMEKYAELLAKVQFHLPKRV